MFVMPCAIVAILSLCLSFLCFGLLVRTWSRPYGFCHRPCTSAHIKGFGSPYFSCLCLFASMLYACVSLSSSRLCHDWHLSGFVVVWLHSTPIRPCLDVTIWVASPWCWLLHAHLSPLPLRVMICLPCLFVSPVNYLCIFTCLLTCPWVLLASMSSILQHNEVMDTRFKTIFIPCRHHLLFAFLLVYLFACLLAFLLFCLPCLSCLSTFCLFICSLHLFLPWLICWFLVFAFACTHME